MKRILVTIGALCLLALSITGIVLVVRSQRQAQAMQLFIAAKAKTGAFPDWLPPGFPDPFTDKPLLYRREGSGFVVYSAGPTGHFDGGKPGQKVPGVESLFRYPAIPLPSN